MDRVLYVGSHLYDVAQLVTVAERARDQLGLDAVFASIAPPGEADQVREQVARHGFDTLDRPILVGLRPAIRNPIMRVRAWREANRKVVDGVLTDLRPVAVISTVNPPPSLFLDGAARLGVPAILLQLWFWGDAAFQRAWRADDRRSHEAPLSLTARTQRRIERGIASAHGIRPHTVWNVRHATVAVEGPALRRQLVGDGVPEQNVVVTGNPVLDQLHELSTAPDAARWRVRDQLRIAKPVRLITHFRSHEDRMITVDRRDRQDSQAQVIRSAREAAPDAEIVVKVHPREGGTERDWIRSIDPNVIVVGQEIETTELIAASELTVGTFSTTLLQSVALDRPTISAVLWPGLDYWRRATDWSGVDRVDSPAALTDAVRRHLNDPAYRTEWGARRETFRRDHFLLDGRGSERILELLARLISRSPQGDAP